MVLYSSVLDSGITVITDNVPGMNSVSIKFVIRAGSRSDPDSNSGMAHFLEHMMFKGTKSMSALELAQAFDDIGGCFNASTGRETTSYYATVLKKDTIRLIELIADMLTNSTFDPNEIESEKKVVLQEIAKYKDEPFDLLCDNHFASAYPGQFGSPILGSNDSVSAFSQQDVLSFFNSNYYSGNTYVVVCGDVVHQEIVDSIKNLFLNYNKKKYVSDFVQPIYHSNVLLDPKELDQLHMIFGFEGVHYTHSDYFVSRVASNILGGGMSSRLFQEVREKRGLAYSVFSYASSYSDTGVFDIYLGIDPKKAKEAIDVVSNELYALANGRCTDDQLSRAKSQIQANILMSQDILSSRCSSEAHYFVCYGKHVTYDELIEELNNVTKKSVSNFISSVMSNNMSFSSIGDVNFIPDIIPFYGAIR